MLGGIKLDMITVAKTTFTYKFEGKEKELNIAAGRIHRGTAPAGGKWSVEQNTLSFDSQKPLTLEQVKKMFKEITAS